MRSRDLTESERVRLEGLLALVPRSPRTALRQIRAQLARVDPERRLFRTRLERALGHGLRAVGEYAEAVEAYERSRRELTSMRLPHESAVSALGLLDAYMYLGEQRKAFRLAASARRVFERHEDLGRLGKLEANVGNLYHRVDDLRRALERYDRAHRLLDGRASRSDLARIDYNRANIHASLGNVVEAGLLFRSAREAFEEAGETVLAAQVSYGDACLDLLSGEYASAMAKLENVRPQLEQMGAKPLLALADLDLAEVLLSLRLYPEALTVARNAARWFRAKRVPLQLAACEYVTGAALVHLGQAAAGLRHLRRAESGFQAQHHETGIASVEMARAAAAMRTGHSLQAAHHAARARRVYLRRGLRSRSLIAAVVQVGGLLDAGRGAAAVALGRRLLARYDEPHDAGGRARLHHLLGKAAFQSGRALDAVREYECAISTWRHVQAGFFVEEWRLRYESGEPVLLDDLLAALLEHRPRPSAREVWSWIARVRALEPVAKAQRAPKPSAAVREEIDRLKRELDGCYARVSGPSLATRGGRATQESLGQRILRLERRLHRLAGLEGEMQSHPTRPTSRRGVPVMGPEDGLIAYFSTGQRIGGLALLPDHEVLAPDLLALDELTMRLPFLRQHLEAREQADARRRHHEREDALQGHLDFLGERLLAPLLPATTRVRRLRVVPYGRLNQVPFAILRWSGAPLAERFEIVHGPFPQHPGRLRSRRALVVGYAPDSASHIRREVSLVARELERGGVQVTRLLGRDATRSALFEHARGKGVVHIAAHGVYRPEHPEFSALQLADGWLNARDLPRLPVRDAFVLVSACESGPRGVIAGDEILGLVRGFTRAGAASILASLWRVNDRATSRYMAELYAAWRRRRTIGAALREAQTRLRHAGRDGGTWGAFALYGASRLEWPTLSPRGE